MIHASVTKASSDHLNKHVYSCIKAMKAYLQECAQLPLALPQRLVSLLLVRDALRIISVRVTFAREFRVKVTFALQAVACTI